MTDAVVLDSSALLCLLNAEPGADRVAASLEAAVISAVNLAEVVGKLRERGLSGHEAWSALAPLSLAVHPFTEAQAHAAGALRPETRPHGLSLGDRACLALAQELRATALTADRNWRKVDSGIRIEVIR